jgi:hypothetical protein
MGAAPSTRRPDDMRNATLWFAGAAFAALALGFVGVRTTEAG